MRIGLCFLVSIVAATLVASEQGWLGIGYAPHQKTGAITALDVVAVVPNGPGRQAGLEVGDQITAINAKPFRYDDQVTLMREFNRIVRRGETISLTIVHQHKAKTVKIVAAETPKSYPLISKNNFEIATHPAPQNAPGHPGKPPI